MDNDDDILIPFQSEIEAVNGTLTASQVWSNRQFVKIAVLEGLMNTDPFTIFGQETDPQSIIDGSDELKVSVDNPFYDHHLVIEIETRFICQDALKLSKATNLKRIITNIVRDKFYILENEFSQAISHYKDQYIIFFDIIYPMIDRLDVGPSIQ